MVHRALTLPAGCSGLPQQPLHLQGSAVNGTLTTPAACCSVGGHACCLHHTFNGVAVLAGGGALAPYLHGCAARPGRRPVRPRPLQWPCPSSACRHPPHRTPLPAAATAPECFPALTDARSAPGSPPPRRQAPGRAATEAGREGVGQAAGATCSHHAPGRPQAPRAAITPQAARRRHVQPPRRTLYIGTPGAARGPALRATSCAPATPGPTPQARTSVSSSTSISIMFMTRV